MQTVGNPEIALHGIHNEAAELHNEGIVEAKLVAQLRLGHQNAGGQFHGDNLVFKAFICQLRQAFGLWFILRVSHLLLRFPAHYVQTLNNHTAARRTVGPLRIL